MTEPIYFPKPGKPYPKESELGRRIDKLIDDYAGELSESQVTGTLLKVIHRINDGERRE